MKKSKKKSGHRKQTPKRAAKALAPVPAASVLLPALPEGKKRLLYFIYDNSYPPALHKQFAGKSWHVTPVALSSVARAPVMMPPDKLTYLEAGITDGIWAPYVLPHLAHHEIAPFLEQCFRLLTPGGTFIALTPNLLKLSETIRNAGLEKPFKPGKPDAPIDFLFGNRGAVERGEGFSYRTGFVPKTLAARLLTAGFRNVTVKAEGLVLTASGQRPAQGQPASDKPSILVEDVNEMMKRRDQIDRPPVRWDNPEV